MGEYGPIWWTESYARVEALDRLSKARCSDVESSLPENIRLTRKQERHLLFAATQDPSDFGGQACAGLAGRRVD